MLLKGYRLKPFIAFLNGQVFRVGGGILGLVSGVGFVGGGVFSGGSTVGGGGGIGGVLNFGLIMCNPHLHVEIDMSVSIVGCRSGISGVKYVNAALVVLILRLSDFLLQFFNIVLQLLDSRQRLFNQVFVPKESHRAK